MNTKLDPTKSYNVYDLGLILNVMRTEFPKSLAVHLFGIRYGDYIVNHSIKPLDIISAAKIPESYVTELIKGIKLSEYVVKNKAIINNGL